MSKNPAMPPRHNLLKLADHIDELLSQEDFEISEISLYELNVLGDVLRKWDWKFMEEIQVRSIAIANGKRCSYVHDSTLPVTDLNGFIDPCVLESLSEFRHPSSANAYLFPLLSDVSVTDLKDKAAALYNLLDGEIKRREAWTKAGL